ncbi:hypothetical protein NHX12_006713 [Muraenolepis orangiensis]|uniref:DRBM domain-containing protein n=1 Tax=Muraenolepis orangiensis TaxID=630683 RepID=A0A9Q0IAW5_9TELE|nr:hypothetical protein NHX12_006713 [Muraenolepis orangiensis]
MSISGEPNRGKHERPGHIKTPIQILHEYAIKSGNLPVYTMEVAEGEAHQPSFIFNVNIADVCCSGHGSSKKAAKHRAAEGALSLLQINMGAAAAAGCPAVKAESNGVAAEPSDHPNSVGILQELAMQRGWRLPEYAVQMESGPAHRREFTVTCRMESLSETAMGNSKKGGKKAAAEKMIAKLQSLSGCGEITWWVDGLVSLVGGRSGLCWVDGLVSLVGGRFALCWVDGYGL